jgi:hypothetical protein
LPDITSGVRDHSRPDGIGGSVTDGVCGGPEASHCAADAILESGAEGLCRIGSAGGAEHRQHMGLGLADD